MLLTHTYLFSPQKQNEPGTVTASCGHAIVLADSDPIWLLAYCAHPKLSNFFTIAASAALKACIRPLSSNKKRALGPTVHSCGPAIWTSGADAL